MAGYDRKIDPVTKDYVSDGKGSYVKTATCETAAYHQVQDRFGEWAGDHTAGCRAHAIKRKNNGATMLRLKDAFHDALQVLVDNGRARDLKVELDLDQYGRRVISTQLTDAQVGPLDVSNLLPFGA